MLGSRQRTACGQKFKTLQTVTVPRLYILETVMFVVKNPDKYQTNVLYHSRDTIHLQSVRISSAQKAVCYS